MEIDHKVYFARNKAYKDRIEKLKKEIEYYKKLLDDRQIKFEDYNLKTK